MAAEKPVRKTSAATGTAVAKKPAAGVARKTGAAAPAKKVASATGLFKVRLLAAGVAKMAVVKIYKHDSNVFEFEYKKPRSGSTVRTLIPATDLVAIAYEKGVQIAYVSEARVAFKEVVGKYVKTENGMSIFSTDDGEVSARSGNFRAFDAAAKM